ncbi:hypothetical protein [Nocardia vermiculata]|uniref:Secreted protein n=1 Tax=Nocardia vermiculata TaxID=257274 RepID=A0A846Y0G8_9NOCA|nr:hypothetical protein [Nocardia vermiculata]NKY51404.1 hypothetical protein [Nocardia vermiculata]
MSTPERTTRRRSIVVAAVTGLAAVAVSTTIGAGAAQARPREASCTPVPVDSRVDITCTNTDVGPASAGVMVVCSDLRVLTREERIRPEATIELSLDCGPAAHPVSWNANAKSDHERDRERDADIDRERRSAHNQL